MSLLLTIEKNPNDYTIDAIVELDKNGELDNLVVTDWQQEQINLLDEKERRAKRRIQRMQDCGRWSYYFNAYTGRKSAYTFKCGYFRECEKCRQDRARIEEENIWRTAREKPMFIMRMLPDKASNLLRHTNKDEYVRYPQKDFDIIIATKKVIKSGGQKLTRNWLRKQDWEKIVDTPIGRNKSGQIHLPKSVVSNEKFGIVETKQILSNASREDVEKAMDNAIGKTLHLDPKNAKDVEAGLEKRTKMTIRSLRSSGHHVHTYIKKQKIILSKINWSNNSRSITENLTSEYPLHKYYDEELTPI